MLKFKSLFIAIVLFLFSYQLSAHGYWIELSGVKKVNKPCTIKMYFGDYPVGERLSGKTLDKMKDIKVYVVTPSGERQPVTMTQYNDYWQGNFIPQTKGMYQVTGINDEREVQDWTKHNLGITRPIQYLKAFYVVGRQSDVKATLYLDAQIRKHSKGNYEITLLKDGKALPKQKLTVAAFDKGETELVTDDNGKATIQPDNTGLHILSVDWIDDTRGTFKGKEYETVRHRLDAGIEN